MKKIISYLILIISIISVSALNAGCCSVFEGISNDNNTGAGGAVNSDSAEEAAEERMENMPPMAILDVYQQNSGSDYFAVGNPVYLSAADSSDANGDILNFQWQIGDTIISNDERTSYIFDSIGEYEIILTVDDGTSTAKVSKQIYLIELSENILIKRAYEITVGIEYTIINEGPGDIKDITCLFEAPQTYRPFQIIKSIESGQGRIDDIFTDDYNLITRFDLGDLPAGESARAYINCDAALYEYEYAPVSNGEYSYDPEDSDLSLYTISEYYINSDSQQIKSAVESVVGQETDPVEVAKRLYDFVIDKMVYDEEKLVQGISGYSYASEILQKGKGVCTDYSILYTALCRAAGIPAKFVQGLPVFSILSEGEGELPYGHAWVEIKLPGYGWIPVDITAEGGFMAYNYYLNMETYKGSGVFYKSLPIEGENYYPAGFYYFWEGDIEPDVRREEVYRVSGLNPEDLSVISENEFLDEIESVLSEYNAALIHINQAHSEGWIFNDEQEIAIEETLLTRLIELSQQLKNVVYSENNAADRGNLISISEEIILYKQEQIHCMKTSNHDCYQSEYNIFIDSLERLFDYYNNMVENFNRKY
ncbi:MAG: transglutaminase domain-containing protein [Actinomycetota bacterium]